MRIVTQEMATGPEKEIRYESVQSNSGEQAVPVRKVGELEDGADVYCDLDRSRGTSFGPRVLHITEDGVVKGHHGNKLHLTPAGHIERRPKRADWWTLGSDGVIESV